MFKKLCFTILTGLLINGCAILKPVESKKFGDRGFMASVAKSVNPSDVIAGILMKKGFVVLDSMNDNAKKEQTLLLQYGQGDRRNVLGGLGGYTLEVSIQILDFTTKEPKFICTAEGQGETEADDIRKAITRCLSDL